MTNIINKDCIILPPKPERSPTPSITSKPTSTPTITPSNTATPPVTPTATNTITPTQTSTISATPTQTATKTPSNTPTITRTPTVTPTNICYYQDSLADSCCGQFFLYATSGSWYNTNVYYNQNDRIYITAEGCASHNTAAAPSTNFGPDGTIGDILAVQGRINDSGVYSSIFKVGKFYDNIAPIKGLLELRIYDINYNDNGGGFCVCVKKDPEGDCLANNCVPPEPSQSPTPTQTRTPSKTPGTTRTPTPTQTPTSTPCLYPMVICSGVFDDFMTNNGIIIELQVEENPLCCCQVQYSLDNKNIWTQMPQQYIDCDPSLYYTIHAVCFEEIIP